LAKALKQYIVPAVRKSGLPTEVWAGTLNYWRKETAEHFRDILGDAEMACAIGGIGFQYSHLPWVREYHARYHDVPIKFTESQCYDGENTEAQALRDFQDFVAYARTGCRLFTFWNMVLPEPRKSTWGWRQNSLVVIDKEKQTVTYEPTFALARFLGRHVPAGARYLPAKVTGLGSLDFPPAAGSEFLQSKLDDGEQVAAFRKPGGSIVVLLWNGGPAVTASVNGQTAQLPAKSLSAVVIQ
jgi:glucosylceramidase